jgi:hypothetical protein
VIPLQMIEQDDEKKGHTPPPLLMITELGYTVDDWIVTYHFFLGPLDGHFAMYLGPRADMDEAAAKEKAFAKESPQLAQARLALLQGSVLETKH